MRRYRRAYAADEIHNLSRAGKPLLVRYDLAGVKKALSKDALAQAGRRICGAIANSFRCAAWTTSSASVKR